MILSSKEMAAMLSWPECPGVAGIVCGLNELALHSRRAPTYVVSILDPGQPEPSELASVHPDRLLRLRFHDAIERSPGVNLPSLDDVASILDFGSRFDQQARPLVHCHYGISRSTAAMAMLIALDPLLTGVEVFARLLRIRPRAWPNSRMVRYADELLGRNGELMSALARLYLSQLRNVPEIAQFMRTNRPAETGMADTAARAAAVMA